MAARASCAARSGWLRLFGYHPAVPRHTLHSPAYSPEHEVPLTVIQKHELGSTDSLFITPRPRSRIPFSAQGATVWPVSSSPRPPAPTSCRGAHRTWLTLSCRPARPGNVALRCQSPGIWLERSSLRQWGLCSVAAQPGTRHAASHKLAKCSTSLGRASPSRTPLLQFAMAPCVPAGPPAPFWLTGTHLACRCRIPTTPTRSSTRLAPANGERPESNMAAEAAASLRK